MHLNIQDIRDYTGADDAFIVKLFNKFLEHIRNDITRLQRETQLQSWDAVKGTSHLMLSSARIFSLKEIAQLHEQIEKDCINNTPGRVPEMVNKIAVLYDEVIAEIDSLKKNL